jgi:hypothetical protein
VNVAAWPRQRGGERPLSIDEANKLEQRLQAESNKSARFSFFL